VRRLAVLALVATTALAGAHAQASAGERPPDTVAVASPDRPVEQLRFGCRRASDGEHRGIACRWAAADGARRYVLYRSVDGGPRQAIYRTDADGRMGHFDGPLRPGHRYRYAVVAFDGNGRVIGLGGPVTIGIPAPTG